MRAFSPVIELSASRVVVGVTPELQWVYEGQAGQLSSIEEDPQTFMVTLLQLGTSLKPMLMRGLETQGLDPVVSLTFPVHVGVRLGLTWPTDFWQGLAVQWMERERSEFQFLPELQGLALQGSTQHIRHAARRLVRKTERAATSN